MIEEAVRYIDHLHVALLTKLEEQESKTTAQTGKLIKLFKHFTGAK